LGGKRGEHYFKKKEGGTEHLLGTRKGYEGPSQCVGKILALGETSSKMEEARIVDFPLRQRNKQKH